MDRTSEIWAPLRDQSEAFNRVVFSCYMNETDEEKLKTDIRKAIVCFRDMQTLMTHLIEITP